MTGSLDQTVRLWDTNGMQEAFTLDKKNNYDPKKVQLRAAPRSRPVSLSLSHAAAAAAVSALRSAFVELK